MSTRRQQTNSGSSSPLTEIADSQPDLNTLVSILVERLGTRDNSNSSDREPNDSIDIDKFNGRHRSKFRSFMQQCEAAFLERPRHFSSDKNRVTFVGRHLSDLALSWYLSTIRTEDVLDNWDQFLNEFKKSFGDSDEIDAAERKLLKIRMAQGEECISYITRFRDIQSILDYPDRIMMRHFRRGLSDKLQKDLSFNRYQPQNLEELMEYAREADSRHREYAADSEFSTVSSVSGSRRRNNFNRSSRFSPRPPSNTSANSASSPARHTPVKSENRNKNLNNRFSNGNILTSDNKLTATERQRRVNLGLCTYCGKGRHKLSDCFLLQQKNSTQSLSAQLSPAQQDSASKKSESASRSSTVSSASAKN